MAINSIGPVAGAASYKPPVRAVDKKQELKKEEVEPRETEALQADRKTLQAPPPEAPPPVEAAAAPKRSDKAAPPLPVRQETVVPEPKKEPKPEYVEFQSAAAAPAPAKRESAVQSYAKNQNGGEEPQIKIDSAV